MEKILDVQNINCVLKFPQNVGFQP